MFDTGIANSLQIISLPFEILGFSLALIEIRFRNLAGFFRESILGGKEIMEMSFIRNYIENQRKTQTWQKWLNLLFMLGVIAGFFYFLNWFYEKRGLVDTLVTATLLISLFVVIPIILGPLIRKFLRSLLGFISGFAEEREIGVLGLMIAAIGIFCELYQFADAIESPMQIYGRTPAAYVLIIGAFLVALGFCVLLTGSVRFHRLNQ